jgi:ketosteroid isomerase-like protein
MKKKLLSVITIFFVLTCHVSFAQENNETEIRNLEKMEGEAFVKKDTSTLFNLFSPQLVVNTPLNRVATLEDIKRLLRIGKIDLTSSGKNIEKITFINNMAIVMGQDTIKPQGAMEGAGKTVTRRYTDVWIKDASGWKLTVRQATNISVM